MAERDKSIETMQKKIATMQNDHSGDMTAMQTRHTAENMKQRHGKDLSFGQTIIRKALVWFPRLREMLRMGEFCRTVGLGDEQTEMLIGGKIEIQRHTLLRNVPVKIQGGKRHCPDFNGLSQ